MIVTDPVGRVVYSNPVAQSLTGWTQEEAKGRPLTETFNIINEETGVSVENPVVKVIQSGKIAGLANHTLLVSKDGTRRPIDDSAAPITDDQNKCCIGVVLVFRDVTKRRKTEQALVEANEKLTQLDQLKDDFVSTVSHELRTPLAIIKEGVNLIMEKIPGPINAEQEKLLKVTNGSLDRLTRIINDLLDISRIEAGKVEFKIQAFDAVQKIEEFAAGMKIAAAAKKINLETPNLPQEPLMVLADPDKFEQILHNLVGNALKFTPAGGNIWAESEPGQGAKFTFTLPASGPLHKA